MRTLLILGGGLTQCDAITSARRMGLRVVVADSNEQAPGMRLQDPEVIPLPISFTEIEALEAELERRQLRLDAVLPYGSDQSVFPAARLAARLGLTGLDLEAAQACTDKVEMRRRWARAGVPTLPYREVTSEPEAQRAAGELGLPLVIKPPDNAAQRGVQLVVDQARVAPAFAEAQRHSPSRRVLIERYVEGPELAVTTFTHRGVTRTIQITDRITGEPPYLGICLAHVYPSELEAERLEALEALMPRVVEALGVTMGPTYSQVRFDGAVPYVLETGARLGGGRDSELRELLSGQDAIGCHLKLLLGEPLELETELDLKGLVGGGCVQFLTAPAGRLRALRGANQVRSEVGVGALALFIEPGQQIPPLSSGAARVGYLIATGADRSKAVGRASRAAGRLVFDVETPGKL